MDPGDDVNAQRLERPNTNQERQFLSDKVVAFAGNFLQKLKSGEIPAFSMKEDKGAGLLDCAFGEEPKDLDTLLSVIEEHVIASGIQSTRTNLGGISGDGTYLSALGDYLAAVLNRFSADFISCPGTVRMENMVISWAARLFNFPVGFAGNLTSGGSAGTVLALLAARHSKGLRGRDFERSLITVGLFEAIIREVPMDDDFRMDPRLLRDMVRKDKEAGLLPFLVVATIGTTGVGSVDPIEEIADVAEEYNLWFHVDAAYGGFFVLVEELKDYFRGVNRVDSVIVDPHKSLFVPFGTGIVIVKEGFKLRDAMRISEPPYIQDHYHDDSTFNGESPWNLSFELSRHSRGLRVWLPLQFYGVGAIRATLTEKIQLTQYAYQYIKEIPGFTVDRPPQLTVITFHYETGGDKSNESFNTAIREKILADGAFYLSSTRIHGEYRLRMCIIHFRTNKDTLDDFFALLKKILVELKAD